MLCMGLILACIMPLASAIPFEFDYDFTDTTSDTGTDTHYISLTMPGSFTYHQYADWYVTISDGSTYQTVKILYAVSPYQLQIYDDISYSIGDTVWIHEEYESDKPIIISNVNQLQFIENVTSANYAMNQSFDASSINFDPITDFNGIFNGMGYTIYNFTCNHPSDNNVAMFGENTNNATIQNFTMINSSVVGNNLVGTIIADGYAVDLSNIAIYGDVYGNNIVGIAGSYLDDGCTAYRIITSGNATSGSSGYSQIGGQWGYIEDSSASQCAAYGNVFAPDGDRAGGFAAVLYTTTSVTNCYSHVNVSANNYVAGFAYVIQGTNIQKCYATGNLSSNGSVYGFGDATWIDASTVTNSYWDINTTGVSTSSGGTAKTTAQMLLQSTYNTWNFDDVWYMEGYPILQFEGLDYTYDPAIVYPTNATEIESDYPALTDIAFTWSQFSGADSTSYQIARDENYNTLVTSGTTTAFTKTLSLDADDYWFRVRYLYDTGEYSDWVESQFSINTTVVDYGTGIQGVVYSLVGGSKTALNGVKVTAYDYDSNGNINNTFDYITGENGYYLFDDGFITAGTWYLVASKDGYETSSINSVQVVEGYTSIKDITLEEDNAPNYITPHYVRLIPKYLYIITYDDLLVTIYEGDSATSIFSDITGSDGAVGTELDETIKYRITVYNAERGIDDTFYITPTDSEYILPIGMGDDRYEEQEVVTDISYSITQSNINLSAGYINCSYNDSSGTFTSSTFKIYDDNETLLYTLSSSSAIGSYSQVVNASNYTYVATLTIVNSALDNDFSVSAVIHFFNGIQDSFDMGWENEWNYNVLAVIIIILVGTLAGAVHAPVIALLQGAIFLYTLYIGWLPTRLDVIFMGVLGIVIAFMAAMRKGEEGMR